MNITCGLILTDGKKFLSVKPTGNIRTRDIPKGMQIKNETNLQTVIREFKEETGFNLIPYVNDIKKVGIFPYTKQKNLCVFKLKLTKLPDITIFHCSSTYKDVLGTELPEVEDFKYTDKKSIDKFKPTMQEVLKMVFK